jgi:hypothetical protein
VEQARDMGLLGRGQAEMNQCIPRLAFFAQTGEFSGKP